MPRQTGIVSRRRGMLLRCHTWGFAKAAQETGELERWMMPDGRAALPYITSIQASARRLELGARQRRCPYQWR